MFHTQKGGSKTTSSTVGEREGERSEEVVSGACRSAESSRSSPALDVTSDVDHHLSTSSLPPPFPHSASHFPSQQNSKEKITPIDLHVRESRTREEQSNVPKRTSNSPTSSPTESSEGEFFLLSLLSLLSLSSSYLFFSFLVTALRHIPRLLFIGFAFTHHMFVTLLIVSIRIEQKRNWKGTRRSREEKEGRDRKEERNMEEME